jgi:Ser/Thr protein kinase RdoA (MazF antagonist)
MSAQHALQQMTASDQQIWWIQQAQRALQSYQLADARYDWIGYTHNAVFSVEIAGKPAILRLKIITQDQVEAERAEVYFLQQLHAETDLLAPLPLADLLLLHVTLPDSTPVTISAVLFQYITGTSPQPESVTPEIMQQIGYYLATLHHYGRRYQPQQETGADSSRFLLRKTPHFPAPLPYQSFYELSPETTLLFSPDQQAVLAEVEARVIQVMNELGSDREFFGIVHGDMLLKNIILTTDQLAALDFEYFGWGYHVYDLTPVLWQLQPFPHYEQRKQALLHGYARIRTFSILETRALETFIAARQAASMRWVVTNRNNPHIAGKVDAILAQRTAELRAFIQTGQLRRT